MVHPLVRDLAEADAPIRVPAVTCRVPLTALQPFYRWLASPVTEAKFGTKRGRNGKKVGPPVHDDRVQREFTTTAADQLWVDQLTEHPMNGQDWLSEPWKTLSPAATIPPTAWSIPTRSQFRPRKFVRALDRHHLVGSVGRVGAAGDNADMESFFALLQKNVLTPAVGHPRRAANRNRALDRTDLPPPP
ncbi:hypothetical protein FHE65_00145 [Mumia zhuanghuii]|uniref:Transposase n=1 Tax=Mumia zhuanghuii TaxID=2585211 RepID=A0A5C4N2T9_9ACTN|nr:hypothetical protein FHE65_00320 [Mumia zhuanghuii]TNC52683.1 hypothetical protein FHE65_00145 [Mumia zhuanghuii]